ncbi:M20 family metallopeptidase [Alkalihalobacillus sp. TS-13]|uniref:M20 metallopeptidase family protein n=1 Tax=Alkalihalobacillus sp. TS-13 TaxID=2842455 RepID=UPI001C86FA1E|nr:amidohydrolase [Alkalihalobacillus sp. TS-13]
MSNKHPIVQQADRMLSQLINWRRTLHQHPELSFQEFWTSRFVADTLSQLPGMRVEKGIGVETSVIGILTSGEGSTIALRTDIDALPIKERNNTSYISRKEGVMHACGHDAHTAMLLGAATIMSELFQNGSLAGTVKFIFQPAEECTDKKGLSGSPYLVNEGAYENVDVAIALHVCPWLPAGSIQMNDGYSMANVDVFEAKIFGTGGHGAYPERGTDPIWMLGPVMQALYSIPSRKISTLDAAVVSIGQIHAGTASNIIPTEVAITGTLRSYAPEVRDQLGLELKRALSVVEPLGGDFSLSIEKGEPALYNDPLVNQVIKEVIDEIYPQFKITERPFGLGGEDFGYVTQKIPGAMFFLGAAHSDGIQRDLHTPIFDIDESCLPIGTAILAQTAVEVLNGESLVKRNVEVRSYEA